MSQEWIAYGSEARQCLRLKFADQPGRSPLVVLVHGGGWRRGGIEGLGAAMDAMAHRGWSVAAVDYRLVPDVNVERQVADVSAALEWLCSQPVFGDDSATRTVVIGHSAGAHLAALHALSSDKACALDSHAWAGTICLDTAAYDVSRLMNGRLGHLYREVFGGEPSRWNALSPVAKLSAGPPRVPLLLVCASGRPLACPQAYRFADACRRVGGSVRVLATSKGHAELGRQFGMDDASLAREISQFVEAAH